MQLMPSIKDLFDAVLITRILSSFWLAGCLFFGLKLLGTALILRRRLSACRPVTDAAALGLPGNFPPPGRTQTHSRVAGHARVP